MQILKYNSLATNMLLICAHTLYKQSPLSFLTNITIQSQQELGVPSCQNKKQPINLEIKH
jgi:hypothetical protein